MDLEGLEQWLDGWMKKGPGVPGPQNGGYRREAAERESSGEAWPGGPWKPGFKASRGLEPSFWEEGGTLNGNLGVPNLGGRPVGPLKGLQTGGQTFKGRAGRKLKNPALGDPWGALDGTRGAFTSPAKRGNPRESFPLGTKRLQNRPKPAHAGGHQRPQFRAISGPGRN